MESNKVIIIGGGASGLFAAISAAENGAEVTIIEKMIDVERSSELRVKADAT